MVWGYLYLVCCYLSLFICIIAAIKIGLKKGWIKGLIEILTIIAFLVLYWLLESHALSPNVAPFYAYTGNFPDMVRLLDWNTFGLKQCTPLSGVICVGESECRISASVLVLEATMTYCFMWTARLMIKPFVGWESSLYAAAVAPFMVGLMALVLDSYLDPIVSVSHQCLPGGGSTVVSTGMNFWAWFPEQSQAPYWFGIPMFNFAAWYAAPVILVILVFLVLWIIGVVRYAWSLNNGEPVVAPSLVNGLFQLAILLAFTLIFITSPKSSEPPYLQVAIILVAIVISLYIVLRDYSMYQRNNPFRWEFVVPQLLFFISPLLMLLFAGQIDLSKNLFLLCWTALCMLIGIFYALSPYSGNWFRALRNRNPVPPRASSPESGP